MLRESVDGPCRDRFGGDCPDFDEAARRLETGEVSRRDRWDDVFVQTCTSGEFGVVDAIRFTWDQEVELTPYQLPYIAKDQTFAFDSFGTLFSVREWHLSDSFPDLEACCDGRQVQGLIWGEDIGNALFGSICTEPESVP